MKKLLTLTTLLMFAFATMSQAQFVLGGNIGFSAHSTKDKPSGDEHKRTTVNVIPRLGYIFGDNWAGLEVGISATTHEDPAGRKEKMNLITVAPFFRHNFVNANNMGVWVEAQAGASFGKSAYEGTDTEKYFGINAGLRPGVIFYVSDNLSFEASFGRLGFTQFRTEDPNDSSINSTDSDFGLNLNGDTFLFGVNYSFGGGGDK